MHKDPQRYTFYIPTVLKMTSLTFHQEPLEFEAFPDNNKLCVINCINEYLHRTELIRENIEGENKQLILSYAYPHGAVKSATLARYVKSFLGEAGVDLTVFTAHSMRSASTSKANNMGLSLKDINKAAGWRNTSTFRRFYKFPVKQNLGTVLLENLRKGQSSLV